MKKKKYNCVNCKNEYLKEVCLFKSAEDHCPCRICILKSNCTAPCSDLLILFRSLYS